MKSKLEEIGPPVGSSFSVLVNPKMSELFFWHFHPEYELVFFIGADSNRHVGNHLSKFIYSDLVLIGSNIPHLNFDYGVKSDYEKIVIHLRPDFLSSAAEFTPEFKNNTALLELSKHGVAFGETTKKRMKESIFNLPKLSKFNQFLELLKILNGLMDASDKELLHDQPVKNQYTHKDRQRIRIIYEYIDNNYNKKIEINEIAEIVNLSNPAFCRYFKKMTLLTFVEFVNHYRIDKAKKMLINGEHVTAVCYDCGFGSLSYFNRVFKRITGHNPQLFKKKHMI